LEPVEVPEVTTEIEMKLVNMNPTPEEGENGSVSSEEENEDFHYKGGINF